ncbi:MAG: hypothetical protein AB7O62_02655 [Pirellulales bacterium]
MPHDATSSARPATAAQVPARRRLPLKKKLLFAGICLAMMLAAAEAALRLAGFTPLRADPDGPNIQEYFWISDERLGFRNRPDGDYVYEWITARPRVTTDALGFRQGGGWTAAGNTPIVLFIGDSTTFCAEVEDDQTGPAEAARLLARDGLPIRPLNAGCRGYNTLQSLRMLEDCLERFPETRLAVYGYCANDYFENLNPGVYAPAWAPSLWQADDGWRQIEPTPGDRAWGQPFASPRPVRGWRRRQTDSVRAHSALANQALFGLRAFVGHAESAPARTLPRGSVVGTFGSDASQQREWAEKHQGDFVLTYLLQEMQAVCDQHGVALLAVEIPNRSPSDGTFAERCQQAQVRCLDPPAFRAGLPDDCLALKVDGTLDSHLGPRGTRRLAEELAPAIKELLAETAETPGAGQP